MARGTYVESIRLFERGLGLLRHLPESRMRTMHELRLTESLGTALFLTRGYGGPGVEEKFAHALKLCDELGEGAPLRVLAGVWNIHIVRSDRSGTSKLLAHMRRTAEGSDDPVTRVTLHGWSGARAFYAGEFIQARDEMTKATEWYLTQGYRSFVEEYGYDGGIDAFAFLMWSLWILGHPDRALELSRKMLSIAEETANPSALTTALGFSANLARDRGEPGRVLELTQRSITLATEQKLYFWLGPAMCTGGWAAVQQGDVEGGIAQIYRGLAVYETVGVRATYAYHLSGLIEAHLRRGAAQEGLALVDGVLPGCQTLLDCFYEAELHRLEGELRRLQGDLPAAQACFHRALEITRRQKAKSYELRAATSYARLLCERGEREAARSLLVEVYGWFTEGFDTGDLRSAATLLAELG
jgi:predicted ATPase